MKLRLLFYSIFVFILFTTFSSCLGNDRSEDYSDWRIQNQEYLDKAEIEMENGELVYDKISPVWDNNVYVLMHWHNDRKETEGELLPLSNSTVKVKYTLTDIKGDTLDSSASFNCKPNGLITGFWTAVTNMRVNDTVTAVIPYSAGYGVYGSGSVLPYSTLIFGIRLDSIISYQKR
ncbi:MAG: FKBP-type peptidyl-prolyl cis-trans isomerase [Muribaculaceae bacterium]|nr:FKBP-type peptidyl-prolyl cis-trans isomerase [Muribaculaceae bacterium]